MNLSELAGACIMTGFRGATLDDPICREDVELLKKHRIKNVILFDTHLPTGGMRNIVNEDQVRHLTDDLRNELGDDIIIGIDQEGGEVNRLTNFQDPAVSSMLSARMQGAMTNQQLTATIKPVARALSAAGINLTFAPCVDLAINPDNPIIAGKGRSLGRDPERVVEAASTIIKAYHDQGIRCCIKHYPGHGSTSVDTHLGLADITQTRLGDERLVYSKLIKSSKSGSIPESAIMTGHLINRHIDPVRPASLSCQHTTCMLREAHRFDGLVITDSLDMGAIRASTIARDACRLAVLSGADIVLDGFNAQSGESRPHPAIEMHESLVGMVELKPATRKLLDRAMERRMRFMHS